MPDPAILIIDADIAIDRLEVAVLGWARGALRGQSTPIVLFDEIDAYPLAAVAPSATPAPPFTSAKCPDARLGRRASRRQRGRARAACRAAAACP